MNTIQKRRRDKGKLTKREHARIASSVEQVIGTVSLDNLPKIKLNDPLSHSKLRCIVCDGGLLPAFEELNSVQPTQGVVCHTYGNYGSTAFDPLDGSYLLFLVCDDCLVRKKKSLFFCKDDISDPEQALFLSKD